MDAVKIVLPLVLVMIGLVVALMGFAVVILGKRSTRARHTQDRDSGGGTLTVTVATTGAAECDSGTSGGCEGGDGD